VTVRQRRQEIALQFGRFFRFPSCYNLCKQTNGWNGRYASGHFQFYTEHDKYCTFRNVYFKPFNAQQ